MQSNSVIIPPSRRWYNPVYVETASERCLMVIVEAALCAELLNCAYRCILCYCTQPFLALLMSLS